MNTEDFSIDEAVNDVLFSFGASNTMEETIYSMGINKANNFLLNSSFNFLMGGVKNNLIAGLGLGTIPGNVMTVTMTGAQMIQNTIKIQAANAASEELNLGNIMTAMDISATIVTTSGIYGKSGVYIYDIYYDMAELGIRVGAYNSMNQDSPITVEQLIESFEGEDKTIVADYLEWYGAVGDNDAIDNYRDWLSRIYISEAQDIVNENIDKYQKIEELPSIEMLTYEQIQELIQKYNDENYEIDKEIWK